MGIGGTTGIPTSFSGDRIDEVSCGDLDNDGDIDILLVGNSRSYLYMNQVNDPILGKNAGTPMTFTQDPSNAFNSGDGESASMIDIDQDGDLDIYIMLNNNNNELYINNLYNRATPATNELALFVEVLDDRSAYMQVGAELHQFIRRHHSNRG